VDGDAVAQNLFSRESVGVYGLEMYPVGFRCTCGNFGHCIDFLQGDAQNIYSGFALRPGTAPPGGWARRRSTAKSGRPVLFL